MGLTKQQLEALNVSSFPNNTAGLITPDILRTYNSSSIEATVNQDVYTADSASFSSRIEAVTGSGGTVNTGSLLVTASFDNGTRNLTFTKGDATTFNVNIPDVSGSTGNFATTGSNTFTGTQTIQDNSLNILGQFPSILMAANSNGSGSQYSFGGITLDSAAYALDGVIGGWTVQDTSTTQSIALGINTYTNVYGFPNATPVIYGQGQLTGGDDTLIGFPAGRIDLWRNTNLSGSLTVTGSTYFSELTGSLGAFSASVDSRINSGGGSINTGSFATTGSNTFVGNQIISGSESIINFTDGGIQTLKLVPYISTSAFNGNRDTAIVARGGNYNGTTFVPSPTSPVNIIFENALQGPTSITANSIISGSNNIVTGLRTATTNAAEISSNNSYISVFPSTRTPAYAPIQFNNATLNGLITVTNNSVGLSSSLALGSVAFGYGNAASITNANILTQVTLNPNSSSVNLNTVLNAGIWTINGNKVNPDYTSETGSGFSHQNTINLGTTTLFDRASGSFNAGGTTWLRNLYGGVVTATNPLSATASAGLQNTIIFGSNLIVTGSDAPGINNGGSSFFGRYNINDGVVNNTSNVVFAVGGGTSGNTRTPLWIGTNQSVNITGSLLVYNSDSTKLNIDANAVVSGSRFYAGNSNEGLLFGVSTGSLDNSYTRYGRDGFQIYQYQGQPYAFGVICTSDQLNQYTGSQFRWGTVNSLGPIQNYMNMISASFTGSIGGGGAIPGLDYLKDGQILQINRGTTFDKNVYIQQGLYVSQSTGGIVPALTLNGTGGTGALIASGSCTITGSLTVNGGALQLNGGTLTVNGGGLDLNGQTTFASLGSNTFNGNQIVTGSVKITGSLELNGVNISSLSAGAFFSTITQSGSSAVSQSMTFNNTSVNEGVSVNSNTQLTVTNSGTYNIQFSAQLLADTGADTIYIWLKKNGSNVSNSATKLVLANNEGNVAAWNFVENANANDYFELCWESANGDAVLLAENSSGNVPAIPSVIATVTQVN